MSSRMKTQVPKVMHKVCGRPMLDYVLESCRHAGVSRILVVVGYGAELIKEYYQDQKDLTFVLQAKQRGTGHAVLCCKDEMEAFRGDTFVICGDMPLIRGEILEALIDKHESSGAKATLATAVLEDASGYGRIVRDSDGRLTGIVEHKDCMPAQLEIKEVNPSYYLFDNQALFSALGQITPNNAKNEYYLTDTVEIILEWGGIVEAVTAVEQEDAMGANGRAELAELNRVMQQRIQRQVMDDGITIVDPANTWFCSGVKVGRDTVIEPFTYISGNVEIGSGCVIGPHAYLEEGAVVRDGDRVRLNFLKAEEPVGK